MKHISIGIFFFLQVIIGSTQNQKLPFEDDIRRFRENDLLNPPPQHAILFIGSSSFTIWKDLEKYFPEHQIMNRAFGGSTLEDQLRYADQIIFPYNPRQILIYCGENDLALNDTLNPEEVSARFRVLFHLLRAQLPEAQITYIAMKPSPVRWHLSGLFATANKSIESFITAEENSAYINIWDRMLNEKQEPDSSLFLDDMLHMNEKGYRIWQEAIKPLLIK